MSCMAVSIHVRWGRLGWPGGGVRKKQLLDHDIIRLAVCVPQPPDSVPHGPRVTSFDRGYIRQETWDWGHYYYRTAQ